MSEQSPVVPVTEPPDGENLVDAPNPQKRNRKRWLLLAALLLLLMCSGYLWINYLTTRQPINQTLPVAQVAAQVIKPHYLFSIHGAAQPLGIAVTPDGNRIYVGESAGQSFIRVFDRNGEELAKFSPPQDKPVLGIANGISLDDQGRVFVADTQRNEVDVYDAGGNFKEAIVPFKEGWIPTSVFVDGKNMLVSGRNAQTEGVLGMTTSGQLKFHFGHHEEDGKIDGFYDASKAVVDDRGRIYVSDAMNQRVAVFDKDRKFLYNLTGFSLPRGMAIDADQKLYVVDTIAQNVKVLDVSGTDKPKSLYEFGTHGVGDGEFNFPNDIAFDDSGRLYITDRASDRVQVWTY